MCFFSPHLQGSCVEAQSKQWYPDSPPKFERSFKMFAVFSSEEIIEAEDRQIEDAGSPHSEFDELP